MPPIVTYSEEELVLLLKQHSREAFDYLYKQYGAAMHGVIYKVVGDKQTAEDVLQEVFVKIWKNIDKHDAQKGKLYTWMLNIARNTAIDKLRSKGEVMKGKILNGDDIVYNVSSGLKTETRVDAIGLRGTVDSLKPEYKAVIELAYFKGYTLDEISKTLQIPLGTVKTRMRSAIQQLREVFEQ